LAKWLDNRMDPKTGDFCNPREPARARCVYAPVRASQRGFSLMEVMFASTILSIFVLGMSTVWYTASSRVSDLVLKQKAIFVLNAELERLSALYVYTDFGQNGFETKNDYGAGILPATRETYKADLSSYVGNGNNFVTTSSATFATGSEFLVYRNTNNPIRNYVWIDRTRGIAGRISWATTDINVASCINGTECSCRKFNDSGGNGENCEQLDIYVEYPYRISSAGAVTPPTSVTSRIMSLRTIVGHG
jgi:prepilin-type N-terminal cleavage/methylation domain-containing protein